MTTTETPHIIDALNRSQYAHLTTKDVRQLVKKHLGYNARQVSVKKSHSLRYLDVTIRCTKVDIVKVTEFINSLDNWHMDQTDYCSGQSLMITVTDEVWEHQTKDYIDEAEAFLKSDDKWYDFKCGASVFVEDQDMFVSYNNHSNRMWADYVQPIGLAKTVFKLVNGLTTNKLS